MLTAIHVIVCSHNWVAVSYEWLSLHSRETSMISDYLLPQDWQSLYAETIHPAKWRPGVGNYSMPDALTSFQDFALLNRLLDVNVAAAPSDVPNVANESTISTTRLSSGFATTWHAQEYTLRP